MSVFGLVTRLCLTLQTCLQDPQDHRVSADTHRAQQYDTDSKLTYWMLEMTDDPLGTAPNVCGSQEIRSLNKS